MKRFLPIFLLFILFATHLFAQKNDFKKELYIGVGGGAMMPSVDFVPIVFQTNKFGVHGGISAKYISEKSLGLQMEVNFAQRGWTEEFPAETGFAYSRTLQYIEIPLMTHIYFGNKFRFVVNLGPQLSFLVGNSAQMNDALTKDIAAKTVENPDYKVAQYSDALKKFDYGLIGGVGMELKTGIGNMTLEGRYYFGLGDIFESRKSKNPLFNRSANRIIEARLTYFFKVS